LLVYLLGSPLLPSEDTTTTSNSNHGVVMRTFKNLVPVLVYQVHALAAGGIKTRSFVFSPKQAQEKPKLVLISGCPGTGKSVSRQTVATVAK
jgi:2-phosphoglycerate kinase